jgi:hypothetical protein
MTDLILQDESGNITTLGWMDDIKDFTFPSNVAILTFDVAWSGSSVTNSFRPYADDPLITVSGQGGTAQTKILLASPVNLKGQPVIIPFPPFRQEDDTSHPSTDFYDYQRASVLYGLKGSAFPRGSGVFSGAHTQDVLDAAVASFLAALMAEFGWDKQTAQSNLITDFFYDFGVFPLGIFPPNANPALYDGNAITTLIHGGLNFDLMDYRNNALVIPLGPFKGKGKTVTISVTVVAGFPNNSYSWVAGCATYKKPQKGWKKNPPVGWNIGPQTYPTYATYTWHRTQGYDVQLLGAPKSAVDDKEIDWKPIAEGGPIPGPRTIKFTINTTSLAITPSG